MDQRVLILLLTGLTFGIIRLVIPTMLDWSVTSVYKDFVHIYLGILFVYCWQLKSRLLIAFAVGLVLWEVACVFML